MGTGEKTARTTESIAIARPSELATTEVTIEDREARVEVDRWSPYVLVATGLWLAWCVLRSSASGDVAAAQYMVAIAGGFVALLLRSPQPIEARFTVGERRLRIETASRRRDVSIVSASVYTTPRASTVRFEAASGVRYSILCDEDEADRMLRASGVDVLQARAATPVGAVLWVRFAIAVFAGCCGMLFVALFGHGDLALALGGLGGMLLGLWLARPSTIEQGIDGIARTGRLPWRLAWPRVASVEQQRSTLVIRALDGTTHTAEAATSLPSMVPNRSVDLDLLLFMGRVERAFEQSQCAPKLPEALLSLCRNGRSPGQWLDELALLVDKSAPFRGQAIDHEQLARALWHPHASPELRFACAVVLCAAAPDVWRPSVRAASDACVFDRVRAALRAVSDGASRQRLVACVERLGA
ncbi:MAG: hypothetical protein U0269_16980 [Polyangiales bacterium]